MPCPTVYIRMNIAAIIVCAGKGLRLGTVDKARLRLKGRPLLFYSLEAFSARSSIKQIVVVVSRKNIPFVKNLIKNYFSGKIPINVVAGGKERQDSVKNGLNRLDQAVSHVLIHDGARPLVSKKLIGRIIKALSKHQAVVCALAVRDTVKKIDDHSVSRTIDRQALVSVQTPQGFNKEIIEKAYSRWRRVSSFDDAQAVESMGVRVAVVDGDVNNIKITYPEDLELAKNIAGGADLPGGSQGPFPSHHNFSVGFGFDVHRINKNIAGAADPRPLLLGGVVIPCDFSLEAVSDGDVVLHAIADAICGASGQGDIGDLFPPHKKSSRDIDSKKIAAFVLGRIHKKYRINNIDIVIVAQKPPLVKHKKKMTASLIDIFSVKSVNIKIKSKENLDILGGREAIAVFAVTSLSKIKS
jgi:2-C-methyl-D-erythritol 4-phosphate cytidylyltransferase / 2-C-methyl-D-erythritol 2,4-cyclodiphosphate synthase